MISTTTRSDCDTSLRRSTSSPRARPSTRMCRRAFVGLDRFVARERIVAELEAAGAPRAHREAPALRAPRRSQRGDARTVPHRPMVRAASRHLRRRRCRRSSRGARASSPRTGRRPTSSGCATSTTGASADSCGGGIASRPGMTLQGNVYVGRSESEVRARHRLSARHPFAPGRGRARYLVLLGAMAILNARLAAAHDRA